MENKVFRYIICSCCGEGKKVIILMKYLHSEFCDRCGNLLIEGVYGGKSKYNVRKIN